MTRFATRLALVLAAIAALYFLGRLSTRFGSTQYSPSPSEWMGTSQHAQLQAENPAQSAGSVPPGSTTSGHLTTFAQAGRESTAPKNGDARKPPGTLQRRNSIDIVWTCRNAPHALTRAVVLGNTYLNPRGKKFDEFDGQALVVLDGLIAAAVAASRNSASLISREAAARISERISRNELTPIANGLLLAVDPATGSTTYRVNPDAVRGLPQGFSHVIGSDLYYVRESDIPSIAGEKARKKFEGQTFGGHLVSWCHAQGLITYDEMMGLITRILAD